MHVLKIKWLLILSLCVLNTHAQQAETLSKQSGRVLKDQQLSDSALLDKVQRQTFKYFWDFSFL